MTGAELWYVLKYKLPVRYTIDTMPGVDLYATEVLAVIHTRDRFGKMLVSAELTDESRCLIRVAARNVHALNILERVRIKKKQEEKERWRRYVKDL